MRQTLIAVFALCLLTVAGYARAESTEQAATSQAPAEEKAWWEDEESSKPRGYVGGLLGVGFGVNGQLDTGTKAYVDTSLLFALRGGLLLGKGNRWIFGFEVAPVTNRLDWRRLATATGFFSPVTPATETQ